MSSIPVLVVPDDFQDLLNALCVAARILRPLGLHDVLLRERLQQHGFIKSLGAGYIGTSVLEATMKVADAAALATLLQTPATAPALVAKPSFVALEAVSTPEPAPAPAPPPPPPVPALRRIELSPIEKGVLRHAQILSVAVESLQRELDTLLEVLRPHFETMEDTAQMLELSRTLPPGALRRFLEDKASR